MKKRLLVQDFIEQHPDDWEKLLSEKPYSLIITHDRIYDKNLVMFKYSQVDSDMSIKLVQECRGLILDEDTKEIVSYPFNKFFNFGESNAAKIDWTSAHIGQKIDGSLIKIVKINGKLLISTNGTIDAKNAPIAEQINCPFKTFEDIVLYVFRYKDVDYMNFEEGFTYMFELVSPWTRVVVPFKKTDMYFLGKRDNTTFEETYFTDDEVMSQLFDTPDVFSLKSIDECLAAAKEMPWDEEGYVVCDKFFNRVKVKSPSYVAAHHLCNNHVMSYARAIELVRSNEIEEICSYFEEFRPALEECETRFWKLVEDSENAWNEYLKVDSNLQTRKDKALWITKNFKIPGLAFGLLDKKIASVRDFFMNVPTEKILKYLGYKE